MPKKSVLLFDRGDPSYDLFRLVSKTFCQFVVFRCPASSTFPAVEAFVQRGKSQAAIWITPSNKALARLSARQRKGLKAIRVRVILRHHSDGSVSALITNLLNRRLYPLQSIIDLYFRRWAVEEYYRDEKVTLQIETFHCRPQWNPAGIVCSRDYERHHAYYDEHGCSTRPGRIPELSV